MAEGVTLIVKAANQTITDQKVECPLDWSVLRLKDHLSAAYPSKPRAEEQRLIYSGQLLQDHLLLKNILRHPVEGNAYTVHLVCSPPRTRPSPINSTKRSSSLSSSPSSSIPSVAVASSVPSSSAIDSSSLITDSSSQGQESFADQTVGEDQEMTSPPSQPSNIQEEHSVTTSEGLRHRTVGNDAFDSIGSSVQDEASIAAPLGYASFTQMQNFQQLPSQHQLMAMQQMYAQYMASYMQYLQMGTGMGSVVWPQHVLQLPGVSASTPTPAPPTSSTTATAFSVTHTAPQSQPDIPTPEQQQPQQQQQQPQVQPAAVQQQQQQQAPNPQLRMNAQGGEVEEDEEDEGAGRDWLDWVYVGSRMVVLLSIVYFYSTLPRFLLVVGIAMLIYLYQVGWFRPTRRVENRAEGTENNNNNQDDRNNNVPNNNNNNNVPPNLEDEAIPQEEAAPQEAETIERQEPQPPQALVNNNMSNDNRSNEAETDATAEEAAARPPHPSLLSLSWTFLTTFFTSLVPEQPQAM